MPSAIKYAEGQIINGFVFVKRTENRKAIFKCRCGNEFEGLIKNIKNGTKLGCRSAVHFKQNGLSMGKKTAPTLSIYYKIQQRCYNSKNSSFKYYGGKGVSVCDRWLQDFSNFIYDMGERPPKMTLERLDSNGNYEPSNCKWATRKQQSRNTSRNKIIKYNGEFKCVGEWAEQYKIEPGALNSRLKLGWEIGEALTTPIRSRNKIK